MISLERLRLGLFFVAALLGTGAIWASVTAALAVAPPEPSLPELKVVEAPRNSRREDRMAAAFRSLTGRTLVPPAPVAALSSGPPPFKLLCIFKDAAGVKGSDGSVGSYKVGELVKPDGAKVLSVGSNRAVFLWHGGEVTLFVPGASESDPSGTLSGAETPAEFVVTAEEYASMLKKWGLDANVVRGLQPGKDGIRLLESMPEDFPARKYGLKPGDIVKRVNGNTLGGTPKELFLLATSMSNPKDFVLDVDRGGKIFSVKIRLAQPPKP